MKGSPSGTSAGWAGTGLLPFLALLLVHAAPARAQVVAEPILAGQAFLADTALTSGTVVLHRMSTDVQGVVDSVGVAPDGSFIFRLPRVPDPATQEMYFAAVRHDGVIYPGRIITRPIDLDSLYVISAYDTLVAPAEGVPLALAGRSIFFEQSGEEWAITDLFQLRNDLERTLVPRQGGRVWSYPLPEGARDFSAQGEMSPDLISQEGDEIVLRTPLMPGERLFVVRYFVDSLGVAVPTPGETEMIDVLVREPAPAISVEGLVQEQSIQMEPGAGSTYRRFAGQGVTLPQVRVSMVQETPPPRVEWIAVVLALILAGGGLVALRGRPGPAAAPAGPEGREAVLFEIARLDEEYETEPSPSKSRANEYRRRRAELLARLQPPG